MQCPLSNVGLLYYDDGGPGGEMSPGVGYDECPSWSDLLLALRDGGALGTSGTAAAHDGPGLEFQPGVEVERKRMRGYLTGTRGSSFQGPRLGGHTGALGASGAGGPNPLKVVDTRWRCPVSGGPAGRPLPRAALVRERLRPGGEEERQRVLRLAHGGIGWI